MKTPHIVTHGDRHFWAIQDFYGDRRAERSGVLLIRHIVDGLRILDACGADRETQRAFCIHPLVQGDLDMERSMQNGSLLRSHRPSTPALMLAMEYRHRANSYLSKDYSGPDDIVDPGNSEPVVLMLIADKVQNRWSFERYGPHDRDLLPYFRNWLDALKVTEATYSDLVSGLTR